MAAKPWRTFLMVSIGLFASLLDLFIVNVALPDIRRSFAGTSLPELSWVLSGYAIVFAALLVPAGRMADLYGRRRWFILGMSLFTLASLACAAAPSASALIAGRVVQGAGAAILTPASLGLVLPRFAPHKRAVVIAAWAAVGAVGAVTGPPLGGLLVQLNWRWVFLVNLPLGSLSVWYVARRLGEIRDRDARGLPDLTGALALMLGVGAVTLALVKGRDWGWAAPGTLVAFGIAVVMIATAVARSTRHPVPVLELRILRVRRLALAVAAALLFTAAFSAAVLAGVQYLTQVWGQPTMIAGLELSAAPLAAAVFAIVAGQLGQRIGMAITGAIGGLLVAAGITHALVRLTLTPDYLGTFLPSLVILGAGVGFFQPSVTAVVVGSVDPARIATVVGISDMFRQVGAALGVAAFVAIVAAPALDQAVDAYRYGWAFIAATATAAAMLMLAVRFVPAPATPRAEVAAGTIRGD